MQVLELHEDKFGEHLSQLKLFLLVTCLFWGWEIIDLHNILSFIALNTFRFFIIPFCLCYAIHSRKTPKWFNRWITLFFLPSLHHVSVIFSRSPFLIMSPRYFNYFLMIVSINILLAPKICKTSSVVKCLCLYY